MPPASTILLENAASLEMLEQVASRPELLSRELASGWTVAVTLAHLAFWDRRVVRLLEQWEQAGKRPDDVDDDMMNQSLLDEWRALPTEEAARLAVEAARVVNSSVAAVSDRVAQEILAEGHGWLLDRGLHRREHLGDLHALQQT